MVGEGVLHECLNHPEVESVLVINRKTCGVSDPKLKEIIHTDFSDFSELEQEISGYNAAFLCMGTTSLRATEETYTRITHDMTLALAEPLSRLNPDMTLCYVSGLGTDSTEKSRSMWTRVKGRTENDLLKLHLRQVFMFRPGLIQPTKGLTHSYFFYKLANPLIPLLRRLFPKYVTTLREIGLAMIRVVNEGYAKQIVEVNDIVILAKNN